MFNQLMTIPSQNADIQRRGRTIISVSLVLLVLVLLATVPVLLRPDSLLSLLASIGGGLVVVASMALARSGRVSLAAWVLVSFSILVVATPLLLRSEVTSTLLYLVLPIVIAGLVLRPWQVWPVLAACLLLLGYKAISLTPAALNDEGARSLLQNGSLIVATVGVISFIGAQIVARAFAEAAEARRAAEHSALRLQELNTGLESQVRARTAQLQEAFETMQARASEKQALLDEIASQQTTIREMSVPVLPVSESTLVMPLVGDIDDARLTTIQTQALAAIERSRARTLLIDLTGVAVVDTHVAQGLLRTVQAARLLGTTPVLIGIRPEVSQSIVSLGIDLSEVRTVASLANALNSERA